MMTVVDIEKKHKCIEICKKLYENGYIYKLKDYCYDDSQAIMSVHTKYGMIEDEDLVKLFKKNGFNAVKYDRNYDITIWFEKEVENLSAEDCFDL